MIVSLSMVLALAAPQAIPPGTYTYTAALAGQRAGTSTVVVRDDGGATVLDEQASGAAQGISIAGKASLVLGPDLAPVSYRGDYQSTAGATQVTAALDASGATVTGMATGGAPQSIPLASGSSHFVVIEPALMAGLFALPAQMQAWNGVPVTAIAPSYARGEMLAPDATAAGTRPDGVPASDRPLAFDKPYAFTIWYDPATLVPDEIVVPSQGITIVRVRSGR